MSHHPISYGDIVAYKYHMHYPTPTQVRVKTHITVSNVAWVLTHVCCTQHGASTICHMETDATAYRNAKISTNTNCVVEKGVG